MDGHGRSRYTDTMTADRIDIEEFGVDHILSDYLADAIQSIDLSNNTVNASVTIDDVDDQTSTELIDHTYADML